MVVNDLVEKAVVKTYSKTGVIPSNGYFYRKLQSFLRPDFVPICLVYSILLNYVQIIVYANIKEVVCLIIIYLRHQLRSN